MSEAVRRRVAAARRRRFERLVEQALSDLPAAVVAMLDNVEVVVEDEPLAHHLAADGAADEVVFGLYEGVPLAARDSSYGFVLPDKITIFRGPLERAFRSPSAIVREVRITVIHELGHHLGFDEQRLDELGLG